MGMMCIALREIAHRMTYKNDFGRVGIEWKSDKIIIIQSVSFSHHQLVISKAPTPPKNLPTPISMLHLWKLTAQPMPSTGLRNGSKYFFEKLPNILTCSCGFLHCNNLFQFIFQWFQISIAYSHEQKHVLLFRKSASIKTLKLFCFNNCSDPSLFEKKSLSLSLISQSIRTIF